MNHLTSENIQIVLIVIMRGKSVPDYHTIEKSMKEIMSKLSKIIRERTEDRSPKSEDIRIDHGSASDF